MVNCLKFLIKLRAIHRAIPRPPLIKTSRQNNELSCRNNENITSTVQHTQKIYVRPAVVANSRQIRNNLVISPWNMKLRRTV
jgi:hypothetical protein